MCWLSRNNFIESKTTFGSPWCPRPGTESCINTWRFLNLKAKTLQGSSNKPWRSVPEKKKKQNKTQQQSLLSAEWRQMKKGIYNAVLESRQSRGREDRWRETKGGYEREEEREAESEGESLRVRSNSVVHFRCLYSAFLRHWDQLWRLSLIVNSFRFN